MGTSCLVDEGLLTVGVLPTVGVTPVGDAGSLGSVVPIVGSDRGNVRSRRMVGSDLTGPTSGTAPTELRAWGRAVTDTLAGEDEPPPVIAPIRNPSATNARTRASQTPTRRRRSGRGRRTVASR